MAVTLNANTSTGFIATSDTSGVLQLQTGGTTAVTVDASQNVGVGVTPSAFGSGSYKALQIGGSLSFMGRSGGSDAYMMSNTYFDQTNYRYTASLAAARYTQSGGEHQWYNAASGTAGNAITFTQAMTLNASGNLGIGTSSPSDTSSYGRALDIQSSTGAAIYLRDSDGPTTDYGLVAYDSSIDSLTLGSVTASTGIIRLIAAGNEAARIDSSGNLLVGNTQTDKGVLTVYNNAASFSSVQAFAYFKGTQASDSGTSGLSIAKYANDNGGSQIFVRFLINNGNNGNGQIVGAGSGAAAFSSYSDARLKENIVDLPSQIDNIMALRPVEFDYKDGSGHQIGFIAQEMQEVYPDTVIAREPDEMLTVTGWSKTEARLVKAIQEQQALIQTLTDRITSLEGTTP